MAYAARRNSSSVACCAIAIRCGTRYEEGFHSGTAHFAEHALFRGTSLKSARVIGSFLDRLGGDLNAYTTKEEIVIHATVLKEDVRKAASLLMELASMATFPEDGIITERGVVLDEIISYKDSPADDVYDRFEEEIFEGHPLGTPILGTSASVRKITSKELKRFYSKYFRPERMAFSVVADIDEKKMEAMIRSLSGKYFAGGSFPSGQLSGIPADGKLFDRTVEKRNHEVNAVIGAVGPSLYDDGRYAAALLANILGGPASNSVLGSILRERNGWVYGVECTYTQYTDTGLFAISFGCDRPNLDRCLSVVERETAKMASTPLSPRRLAAAKKQLLGQMAIASESGEARSQAMAKSLLAYGRVAPPEETRSRLEAVTPDDLMLMAQRLFKAPSRLIYL